MAVNTATIEASSERVFEVLADGWRYSNWVVGTSHMFAVEANWPEVGSKLFHASGAWPLVLRDETQVQSVEPGRRLELIARGRPFGEARIVIELAPQDGGCLVTMTEEPVAGPGKWLHNKVSEAVLHRRNEESLARLVALAELRTAPPADG
jgi:uncharacterized protein YndB with AHSA1/START domain